MNNEEMQGIKKLRLKNMTKDQFLLQPNLSNDPMANSNTFSEAATYSAAMQNKDTQKVKEIEEGIIKRGMSMKMEEATNDNSSPDTIRKYRRDMGNGEYGTKPPRTTDISHISDATRRYSEPKLIKAILGGMHNFQFCNTHEAVLIPTKGASGIEWRSTYDNRMHNSPECEIRALNDDELWQNFPKIRDLMRSVESLRQTLDMGRIIRSTNEVITNEVHGSTYSPYENTNKFKIQEHKDKSPVRTTGQY